jgi:hypothetical protein
VLRRIEDALVDVVDRAGHRLVAQERDEDRLGVDLSADAGHR